MISTLDQLRDYLEEMFQFNANDLDFGIYKIYNLKREKIREFIHGEGGNDLQPIINSILEDIKVEESQIETGELYQFLKEMNQESLLNDAEENYEQLELFIKTEKDESKKERLTQGLKASVGGVQIDQKIRDQVYNHILGFFQMYYSNGDFGYNDRSLNLYQVPYETDYNGSDTLFHWKHKGSLYIKTGASFNAVKFKLRDKEIEYRVESNEQSSNEETTRNNNKDSRLKHYALNRIEKLDDVYRVVFHLSDSSSPKAEVLSRVYSKVFESDKKELEKYLSVEMQRQRKGKSVTVTEGVFNDLVEDYDKVQNGGVKGIGTLRITKKAAAKKAEKNFGRGHKLYDEKEKKFLHDTFADLYTLDQKLNSFYIGNDSDYFIHEDLHGFLSGEKQRYVKNYIFQDLESIYNGRLDNRSIVIAKAFDRVSSRIIDFLAAIEEFQKNIFTRKKKVVESEYCLTIDNLDKKHWPEILKNKAQLAEWKGLYGLEVKKEADLKENPTLVLDTKHWRQNDGSNSFKDAILHEIDRLDERTNGLLVNSENYQALELLKEGYRKKVSCIYIDPPYNASSSSIIYKNHFKHSSWLSLMENRIRLGKVLLKDAEGVEVVAIDENEQERLGLSLNQIFNPDLYEKVCVSVIHNPGGIQGDNFKFTHEYAYFLFAKGGARIGLEKRDLENADVRPLRDVSTGDHLREDAANCFYPIYVKENKVIGFGEVCPDDFHPSSVNVEKEDGTIEIYPIDPQGNERKWVFARQTVESIKDELKVHFNKKRKILDIIRTKQRFNFKTVWVDKKYNANIYGTKVLNHILPKNPFSFPKSVHTVSDCIDAALNNKPHGTVLDFFAGSGTTAHAVINLNKEDEGNRKYVLVEMGQYFETVTVPRIKRILFSSSWKNGVPKDDLGSPNHVFKYQVLEQYEDILDHIEAEEVEEPENLPLKYIYRPEENKLYDTLDLSRPFANKINYSKPTKEGFVDLVETYNYLMGYEVRSIRTYSIKRKYYKVVHSGSTLVVWRDIEINEDDTEAVKDIIGKYDSISVVELNFYFELIKETDKEGLWAIGEEEIRVEVIGKEVFYQ